MTPKERAVVAAAVASYHANLAWWSARIDASAQSQTKGFYTYLEVQRAHELAAAEAHRCALAEIMAVDAYWTRSGTVSKGQPDLPRFPCASCGKLRTRAEGGDVFTTCEGLGVNCDGTVEGEGAVTK